MSEKKGLTEKTEKKGIWKTIKDYVHNFLYKDLFIPRMENDIVSSNAKVVLYGLFALVGFAILTYAMTVTGDKFDDNSLNDTQKVERFQQLEQINAVYIAAISGSLALGGTLVARLWGRG